MIEKIILDYLTDALTVPVYMEIPASPPGSFVVIEKTGSSVENRLWSAMFAIQSYGPSMYAAASLNEEVKAAMLDAVVLDDITSVDLNSDYNFTDTGTKRYRYQAVFDIFHY